MTDEQALEPTTEESGTPDLTADNGEEAQRIAEEQDRKEQEETENKPWFKKRFDELTRKRKEAERLAELERQRAERLENEARQLRENQPKPKQDDFQPTRPRPTREQFNFDEDAFIDAVTDWKWEQNQVRVDQQRQKAEIAQKQQKEIQTFEQKRAATVDAGKTKFNDWEDTVYAIPGTILHQNLAAATMELGEGAAVMYYLGKNLPEAEKISKLSPYAMAAELGKIEAKLLTQKPKTTNAPEPINPIKGAGSQISEIDPDKDPKGWIAARNAGKV